MSREVNRSWAANKRRAVLLSAVIAASLLGFGVVEQRARSTQQLRAESAALDLAAGLRASLATPVESLHALKALFEAPRQEGLSQAQFAAFAAPLLQRHPQTVALEWFPLVPSAQREFLERWLAHEQPGFEIREPTRAGDMVRAVARPLHVPLVYSEPKAGPVQGLDLAFDEARLAPVRRALASDLPTLSDRYQLVEDPPEVFSVVAYAKVRGAYWLPESGPSAVAGGFREGVVVALFRLNRLFEIALGQHPPENVSLELWDPAAPAELQFLYRWGAPQASGLRHEADLSFVDRTYRLVVLSPAVHFAPLSWLVLAASLAFGLALIAYFETRDKTQRLQRAVARLGQYQIERKLASGGMGTVYRAHHALLRRPTAIKIAHPGQAVARLEKEVVLTSTLTHPNTVAIYDFGRSDAGTFYYAMEYIEGYDLQRLVDVTGPLPSARVIRILLQACGALQEAHQRGLVHRDIKPSNLMLTERGGMLDFVKVLDFGLARYAEIEPSSAASRSIAFAGTPGYVAPEVVASAQASVRSDIFSLGAVGYFLLSGRGPFAAQTAAESLTLALTQAPAALGPDVPEALAELIRLCLARTPEARPSSMQLLAERLKQAATKCATWTQVDAERWWQEHPVPSDAAGGGAGSTGAESVFVDERRFRSSLRSES